MYDTGVGKRNYVTIDQMPDSLINATIAAEDETFQKNNGVDPKGIVRAAAFSVGVTVFAYVLFATLLKSPLPPGPFGF